MIGAIGLDVTLHENGKVFDALEIRYFENDEMYIERLKYVVNADHVEFY